MNKFDFNDIKNDMGNQMDISEYNPFVFEFINTSEYVLFTCTFDKSTIQIIKPGNILIPCDFFNVYIKSLLEVDMKKTTIQGYKYIYEKYILMNNLVNSQGLGLIEFEGGYYDPGSSGSIEPFTVTKATGMFAGVCRVIKDFTQPTRTLYFVKKLDY